jgi:hypothetical protein
MLTVNWAESGSVAGAEGGAFWPRTGAFFMTRKQATTNAKRRIIT